MRTVWHFWIMAISSFFENENSMVNCVHPKSGDLLWGCQLPPRSSIETSSMTSTNIFIISVLEFTTTQIIEVLVGIDITTGDRVWTYTLPGLQDVSFGDSMFVDMNNFLYASTSNLLFKINGYTGEPDWAITFQGSQISLGPSQTIYANAYSTIDPFMPEAYMLTVTDITRVAPTILLNSHAMTTKHDANGMVSVVEAKGSFLMGTWPYEIWCKFGPKVDVTATFFNNSVIRCNVPLTSEGLNGQLAIKVRTYQNNFIESNAITYNYPWGSSGLSSGAKAGIAIGVIIGAILLGVATYFGLRYYKINSIKSPKHEYTAL